MLALLWPFFQLAHYGFLLQAFEIVAHSQPLNYTVFLFFLCESGGNDFGLLAIFVSRVCFRRVSVFWEARVFACAVFPFQGFLCTGCTVNAESTAACVCSEGWGRGHCTC